MHLSTRRDRSYLSHWRICTYIIYLHSHKTTRGMSFDCLLIRLRPRGIVVLTNACIHARMYDDEPESDAHKCPAGTRILVHMNTDYIPSVSWTRTMSHMWVGKHVDDVAAGPTDVPTYRYIAPAFFDPMIYEQTYNHVLWWPEFPV